MGHAIGITGGSVTDGQGIALRRPSMPGRLAGLLGPALAGGLVVAVAHAFERVPDAGLLLLCAALIVVSALVLHREIGLLSLRRLTIPGVWYLTYLQMILVPSLFVFAGHPGPTRGRFITGVLTLLATVPAGVVLVNRLARFRPREIDRYLEAPILEPPPGTRTARNCAIALVAALGLALLYISEVKIVPLFHMIRHPGDVVTLVLLREESLKLLTSPLTPAYYLLRTLGFPLLILVTLGHWLGSRQRSWLVLFVLTLLAGVVYGALSIAKAPVAEIVLVMCLFLFLRQAGRIPAKAMVLGAAAGIVLMVSFPLAVVLAVRYGTGVDAGVALLALGRRIAYLPAEVVYWYFTLFPGPEGYLHGRTIGALSSLMGWSYFNAPNHVGRYGLGSWIESVNANGSFIGYLYADFGMGGVLLGGLAAGAIMQGLQIWLLRRPKTVFHLATYTYLIFAFWLLHSTSLPVVLSSNGVLLLVLAPGVWGAIRDGLGRFRDLYRLGRAVRGEAGRA
jgi:oligosaccharide repeat unit polymerase